MAEHIGARVRVWRARRGLSQATLAGLAGLSQGYISQIEAGVRGVERRSTMVALANALKVSVADLLGQPSDPSDPLRVKASETVSDIKIALVEHEVDQIPPPSRSQEKVAAAVDRAMLLRQNSDYLTLAPELPTLLRDAAAYRNTDALVRSAYEASVVLRNLGYRDLSWPAAKLAVSAANELGDPAWIGAANFIYVLSLPFEAADVASRVGERSLAHLQAHAADKRVRQMLGLVHLSSALTGAVAKRTPEVHDHLREASKEAATLGDPTDAGFNVTFFGPTNVKIWKMSILTELAEYGKVLETAQGIPADALPVANRRQSYHMALGRSLAHSGKNDKEALVSFARAERAAPAPFRLNPQAADAIATMIRRAKRRAVAEDLVAMARRLGLDPYSAK